MKFKNKFGNIEYRTHINPENAVEKLVGTKVLLGLDIETAKTRDHEEAGLCPHMSDIRLVQVYDPRDSTVYVWDTRVTPVAELFPILKSNKFVAHNALFEMKHILRAGVAIDAGCSMLLSQLVANAETVGVEEVEDAAPTGLAKYRKLSHSLDAVCQRELGMAVDKQLQGSDWGAELSKDQYMYAALDAVLTHAVAVKLAERVKKHGLERAYKSIRDTQMIVAKMELNGMPVDWEYHRTLIDQWKAEEEKASVAVKQYFGDINVASPKQMRQWLEDNFSEEELRAWPRTKPTSKAPEGNYSFEHDQISFMRNVPAVGALLEYKRWAKLLSTYGESLREKRNPVTGNIHTSFTLCSTATGRMSSRNPNVQNMPSEDWFRNVFCAPPGWSLVVSDFSQIELRLQAEMSQDPQMLKIYRDGLDAYCEMAGSVYGGKVTKEDKVKRSVGKVLMLSLGYGMGVNTLERRGKIAGIYQPRSFWEKAFKAYKDKFKHYAKWCENIRTRATKLGYIDTLGGMRRKLDPDFIYTQSVNTVIQGTAAELMRLALQKVDKDISSYGYIVAPVHDEIVLAVPNEASEEASKALTNGMCSAMQEMFPKAASHNVAKAAVASRWGEAKGEL